MSEKEKVKLVVKAIRTYCQEHYGWSAKYHPDDREKYDALMEMAAQLEGKESEK